MTTLRRIFVVLLPVFLLTACVATTSLAPELETRIAQSEASGFKLSDLDAVEGAQFLVACPYESPASIEGRLGFDWPDAPDYSQREDKQSVIVVDGDEVTSHSEFARHAGDFCSDEQWQLSPIDTNLSVTRSGDSLVVQAA